MLQYVLHEGSFVCALYNRRLVSEQAVLNRSLTSGVMILVHWISGYYVAIVTIGEALHWPQGARILLVVLTNVILAYEFVYLPAKTMHESRIVGKLLGVSLIPFCLGIGCVTMLFAL